ncbi:class I adenylate-forming enzyme family protein [Nonomuraea jabiensis]|uniref:class I adenylate-forming enzyme family protein n=1 Tax=Nonomuraea jabiensis TaxID=882448 RepID=UPI0036A6AF4B
MLRLLAGEAARRFGGRSAVVTGSTVLTFADLDRLSDQVAAGLAHRGTRVGDVVALALPDGPEFVICYVAAAKIDAVTAGIGTERPELLARLDPAIVITAPGVLPPLPGLDVVTLPIERGGPIRLGSLCRREPPPPPFPPDPARPVVITFTSGRTGPPKGVVFGNRQLEAIKVIREHGIEVLRGTPYQLSRILACGGDLPDLALILSSGAPAPPKLIRALRTRYRVPVCNRYICPEAGLGLGTRPDDPPEDAEVCVGRPGDGVDVSIRNADGRVLSDEDEGEVLLRSEAVMSGYVGKHTDHAVFARDGFIRTGDRGYLDHTGRLHLVGRV